MVSWLSKTSATGQLITMVHVVMHLVADDGNYPYPYKVDLEKIDLRDEKWTSEFPHDCLLKVEKTFLTGRVALPEPDRRRRLELVLRFICSSGWPFSVISDRSYTLVHKSSSRSWLPSLR